VGFLLMLYYLLKSLKSGAIAPQNPWGGKSLEWTDAASPPVTENFEHRPVVTQGPYEFNEGKS
jgi:cytochrome c oxidase subunit 1